MRPKTQGGYESAATDDPYKFCTNCGRRVTGIATRGPDDHRAQPCGCRLDRSDGAEVLVDERPDRATVATDGGEELCEVCDLGDHPDPSPATTTYSGTPVCEQHASLRAAGTLAEVIDLLEGIDWRHVDGLTAIEAATLATRLQEAQYATDQAAGYKGEAPSVDIDETLATDGGERLDDEDWPVPQVGSRSGQGTGSAGPAPVAFARWQAEQERGDER